MFLKVEHTFELIFFHFFFISSSLLNFLPVSQLIFSVGFFSFFCLADIDDGRNTSLGLKFSSLSTANRAFPYQYLSENNHEVFVGGKQRISAVGVLRGENFLCVFIALLNICTNEVERKEKTMGTFFPYLNEIKCESFLRFLPLAQTTTNNYRNFLSNWKSNKNNFFP